MPTKIFVSLPVKQLDRSIEFFATLGFRHNPHFSDQTAAYVIITEDIYVMLLTEPKFKSFTPKQICDASKSTEVLIALTCESRERVDELVRLAVSAGGTTYAQPQDYGFMYQHGFQDPDGHIWELVYMSQPP